MDTNDNKRKTPKRSKVIKPKQFNKPGRKLPKKTDDLPNYFNPELLDPGIDPYEAIPPEDMEELAHSINHKSFTPQEEKLITLFMQYPLLPKNHLVGLAGFKTTSPRARCNIFAAVMVKLDSARHHKALFREIGFGEVQIILRMKELAMQNSNLTVASNMTVAAARCLDMQKGELVDDGGFSITVTRAAEPGAPVETGPERKHAPTEKKGTITR